jgi:hypothetical protein
MGLLNSCTLQWCMWDLPRTYTGTGTELFFYDGSFSVIQTGKVLPVSIKNIAPLLQPSNLELLMLLKYKRMRSLTHLEYYQFYTTVQLKTTATDYYSTYR